MIHRQALQLPPRFFLFVGRLVREKGVFDLLEAYGKLTPELRAAVGLVLVGEGTARAELVRRASLISAGTDSIQRLRPARTAGQLLCAGRSVRFPVAYGSLGAGRE